MSTLIVLKSEQKWHINALNHRKKKGPSRVIDKNLKSIHDNPIKTGHVQREFHGMPAGRHETLAVVCRFTHLDNLSLLVSDIVFQIFCSANI